MLRSCDRVAAGRDRGRDQYRLHVRLCIAQHSRRTTLEDPRLLARHQCQGVAQKLLVIKTDRRHAGTHGGDHVGGVEASAQPDFDDGHIDASASEPVEGHGRGHLEKRRTELLHERGLFVEPAHDFGRRHGNAVHDNTLAKVDQMRGRVSPHTMSRVPQQRVEGGDHTTLAIRTGNMKHGIGPVRIPDRIEECLHTVEAESPDPGRPREQSRKRAPIVVRYPDRGHGPTRRWGKRIVGQAST